VLVVENVATFRKVICSTLGKRPGLQVICELSDGLEAVQKAEELRPDLILLDIGLLTSEWNRSRPIDSHAYPGIQNNLRESGIF
jgi:CheY-like chemotaxis protein